MTWIIWLSWDYYFWKFFSGKFGVPLIISGNWKGTLDSEYNGRTQKVVNVSIQQTYSKVIIEIKTDQITSCSICTHWEKTSSLNVRLLYIYRTYPLAFDEKDNLPQYGGGMLIIKGKNNLLLTYWTTSATRGSITLQKI